MESKVKQTCVRCKNEIKYSVSIQTTNMAYPVLVDKPIYKGDERLISVCHNPECQNYGLLQISAENMPIEKPEPEEYESGDPKLNDYRNTKYFGAWD